MTDLEKPSGTSSTTAADNVTPVGSTTGADNAKQEAGEREQGVRSEDSEDLSSPQLTERNDA